MIDMNEILRSQDLCKYYGTGENQVKAVDHASISIHQGEFAAIVGKSGSGKSTLLHMLGGLDTPTSGTVWMKGKDIFSLKEDALAVFRRRKIGFIFQTFNLVSSINVWENIVLPIGLDGRQPEETFVRDIIQTLGIALTPFPGGSSREWPLRERWRLNRISFLPMNQPEIWIPKPAMKSSDC